VTRAALAAVLLVALSLALATGAAADTPAEQITWAVHTTLVPTYFDPAETTIITSFMVLYALHDGVVKPMPGKPLASSLAESWSVSADRLVYDFVLRRGVKFHNGAPVTAEDVKFSFETPDASRVRFRLRQAWPDFMTFYGTLATAAGWVVPKK